MGNPLIIATGSIEVKRESFGGQLSLLKNI
jgi:hypothetical protein